VSIPCMTGPYVGVNCKLTLLKSSIRKAPLLNGTYAREGSEEGSRQWVCKRAQAATSFSVTSIPSSYRAPA
jgi:hypothetical protein